jgi:Ca2+/Na+ antiporter
LTPSEIYHQRTDRFRQQAEKLQKLENQLSIARLISFLSGLILFFALISVNISGAVIALLLCLIVFAWLVKYHSRIEKQKEFSRFLETINHLEGRCLQGQFFEYPSGAEHINRDHPNSYDLDLFGHASLFQYMNRTTSKPAADMLASWLKSPASISEIELRQQAFNELGPEIDWRQKLIALGYTNKNAQADPRELILWINGNNYFIDRKFLKAFTYGLIALGFISTALVVAYSLPAGLLIPVFGINFLFYFFQGKNINRLHGQVGRSSGMLESYSSTIQLIESRTFSATKLRTLHQVFSNETGASRSIGRLSKLVSRLDVRLNVMVAIPLNLLFFWDILCCFALENWKVKYRTALPKWFDAMAEFECLSSIANMSYNNPEWTTPVVVPDYFTFKAENAGHPLIPESRRISNTLEIPGDGRTVLVTGSNMSGKSTFLRTCGVNCVLAFAGAPVCASSFRVSHVKVYSSMRISDSLEDNTSSFYAELKRLSAMIKEAEHNQKVFLLLDEILRGTNSNDRHTGSVALIKQLIDYGTVAIVATHDLKLAELAGEMPGKIDNYHFDVKIDGEELYFDYMLNKGICTSMNASILMKKMGIRV